MLLTTLIRFQPCIAIIIIAKLILSFVKVSQKSAAVCSAVRRGKGDVLLVYFQPGCTEFDI